MELLRRLLTVLGLASPLEAVARPADARPAEPRLSFEDSWRRLQALGLIRADEQPRQAERMPQYADEELIGADIFRTELADADLSNLTMPRTFFGKSEVRDTSFRNSDLRESNLCWNDFVRVDFSQASLVGADLRSSLYDDVCFDGADLRMADLRRCDLDGCTFIGADLRGAIISFNEAVRLPFSHEQKAGLDKRPDDGPEPDGG